MSTNETVTDHDGYERHPSFGNVVVTRTQGHQNLHGSDLPNQNAMVLRISAGTMKDEDNSVYYGSGERILELRLSENQWARMVSSIGQGDGTPVTITYDHGPVPPVPERKSNVEKRADDIRAASQESIAEVTESFDALEAGFEAKAGRATMRELIRTLRHKIGNVPANQAWTVKMLDEALEAAKAEAKSDLDAYERQIHQRIEAHELAAGVTIVPQLSAGSDD